MLARRTGIAPLELLRTPDDILDALVEQLIDEDREQEDSARAASLREKF